MPKVIRFHMAGGPNSLADIEMFADLFKRRFMSAEIPCNAPAVSRAVGQMGSSQRNSRVNIMPNPWQAKGGKPSCCSTSLYSLKFL